MVTRSELPGGCGATWILFQSWLPSSSSSGSPVPWAKPSIVSGSVLAEGCWGRSWKKPAGVTESIPHPPNPWLCRIPSSLDNSLLHAIETIIIDWSHQIRDVLSKDSAQALLDGLHPLPRVEFEFWDARLMNLKYIHEQVMALLPPAARCPLEA